MMRIAINCCCKTSFLLFDWNFFNLFYLFPIFFDFFFDFLRFFFLLLLFVFWSRDFRVENSVVESLTIMWRCWRANHALHILSETVGSQREIPRSFPPIENHTLREEERERRRERRREREKKREREDIVLQEKHERHLQKTALPCDAVGERPKGEQSGRC